MVPQSAATATYVQQQLERATLLEAAREDARGHLTIDVPSPEAILGAARMKAIRESAAAARSASLPPTMSPSDSW